MVEVIFADEVDDLDPDSATPDELVEREEKKKEAEEDALNRIANEEADHIDS